MRRKPQDDARTLSAWPPPRQIEPGPFDDFPSAAQSPQKAAPVGKGRKPEQPAASAAGGLGEIHKL